MKWVEKSRSLEKDLSDIANLGKRLKLIREAKNRISDFKGEYGFRQVASSLNKAGIIPDGTKGRKILKEFEEGHRALSLDHKIPQALIKILNVNADFACGSKESNNVAAVSEDAAQEKQRQKIIKDKSPRKEIDIKVVNKTEFSNSFYFKYYPDSKLLIMTMYGDEPVPTSEKSKSEHGRYTAELWVPGMLAKYAGTDKTKFLPSEKMVSI